MGQIMAIRRRARQKAAARAQQVLPDFNQAQEILDRCRAQHGSDIGIDEAQKAVDAVRAGSSARCEENIPADSTTASAEARGRSDLRSQWDLKSSPEVYVEKYADADVDSLSDAVRDRLELAQQIVNG